MTCYKFYREETGEYEDVDAESWRWLATYNDGRSLSQFDESTGLFHQFKEIDQSILHSFTMYNGDELHSPITILLTPGAKLIHFYRNIRFSVGTPNETHIKLYCFGYQIGNVKVIMVILPDGNIAVVDDVDKILMEAEL
jgi:hypothetical protein